MEAGSALSPAPAVATANALSGLAGVPDDVLREVGPEDVNSAGELVKNLGAHNKGQQLIVEVAASKPRAVVNAQSRPEDVFRTRFLDADEVEDQFDEAFGSDVGEYEILSARVKGKGASPERMQVVVLYRVESGRTGRAVLPYEGFSDSRGSYDDAVAKGAFNPFVDEDDPAELRKQLAKARRAVSELRGRGKPAGAPIAGPGIGAAAPVTSPAPAAAAASEADAKDAADVKAAELVKVLPLLSDEGLDVLAAADDRKTVQDAIADERERRAGALDEDRIAGGEAPPDVSSLTELNAKDLVKRIPDLDEAQLNALEKADDRKTVQQAIASERDSRANAAS